MPSSWATAKAVALWSPVIITGRTPARWHLATAAFTSGRGGSIRPNRPKKVSSRSTSWGSSLPGARSSSFRATAITRRAFPAISSLAASALARSLWDIGPLGVLEHRPSKTSGAPFTKTVQRPSSWLCTVDISFRPESKGRSATRGNRSSSRFWSTPSRAAATTSAPSVGSPEAVGAPAFHSSRASEQRAPASMASRRRTPGKSHTCCTVILFWVRVPVLSEQTTPAQPRVSTAGSFFTMAFRPASRWMPRARTMVTMAGRPSGMAATARETAVRNISSSPFPWNSPTPNITAHTARHRKDRDLDISPIRRWSGVSPSPLSRSRPAICPIWVPIPVATTRAVPRPAVISVPEMSMFTRSPKGVSSGRWSATSFSTGTDSPVMADSSAWRRLHSKIRASAGTWSPASRRITSPGTRAAAATFLRTPSRSTAA